MKPNFTRKPSRLFRVVYLLLALLFVSTTAWADNPSWVNSGDSWDAATKKLTVNSSLSSNAYRNCTEIETVVFSNSVESIGVGAFYGCTNLKTVFIGNGVTSIGGGAFYGCNQLESVFITRTSSAPTITIATFPMNANLKIYVPMDSQGKILNGYTKNEWHYNYQDYLVGRWVSGDCMVGLNNGVLTVIGIGAMADNINESSSQWSHSRSDITSIVLNEGVTRIGNLAFPACNNLESVTIPNSVTTISNYAFAYCRSLESINIPNSVTTISKSVFWGCDNLTSITLNGEATIGAYAFPDGASVTIAEGLLLHNGTEVLRGNVTDMSKLNDKTLTVVPWTGAGTADDPFVIENPSQLNLLAQRVNSGTGDDDAASGYRGKYFVLANDIAYDHTSDWDDANSTEDNYTPIGCYDGTNRGFRGIFDGQGNTVSGIRIYRDGNDPNTDGHLGLFGFVDSGAVVKNVGVSDMRITGYALVGGIVGYINIGSEYGMSKVENCQASATVCLNVVQDGAHYIGGIVGHGGAGVVDRCISSVAITTNGTFTNGNSFGGIVGSVQLHSIVKNCLAIGVAIPDISFKDYYQNDLAGSGAIAGYYDVNSVICDNYYVDCKLGDTTPTSGIGIGFDTEDKVRYDVTDNHAAVPATLQTLTLGEHITATGLLFNQGSTISTVSGSTVVLSYSGSLSDGQIAVFALDGKQLSANNFVMPAADATVSASIITAWGTDQGADGSAEHPFIISRPAELDLLAQRVNSGTGDEFAQQGYEDKYFVLANDIAYNPAIVDANGENYTAIGITGHPFCGSFDGQGYTISGIRINKPGDGNLGLFGYVVPPGAISHVTLDNASITGYSYVGGIAGTTVTTIHNCLVIRTSLGGVSGMTGGFIAGNTIGRPENLLRNNFYDDCKSDDRSNDYGAAGRDRANSSTFFAVEATILSETEDVPTDLYGNVAFRRVFTGGKASTICLPFDYTPNASEGTYYEFAGISKEDDRYVATMTAAASTLTANTPYVFIPAGTDSRMPVLYFGSRANEPIATELSATSGDWTFSGTYQRLTYGTEPFDGWVYGFASKTKIVEGEGEVQAGQFVHAKAGASVPPMRCFLKYKNGQKFTANTRSMTRSALEENLPQTIVVKFVNSRGETTAIGTIDTQTGEISTEGWYTLSGTRLAGKPSQNGIYIHNGKKEVVKN